MAKIFEEDSLFLEATHDAAVELLEHHTSKRPEWSVAEIKAKHDYPALLFESSRREQPLDIPDSIREGFVLTLLTENGIVYYPRDVGRIFNPLDKHPSENDPHEEFTRCWTSEEFPHSFILYDALALLGYDMVKYEKDRKSFNLSGLIPRPEDSASGVAYTGTQERSTSTPYQNMKKILKTHLANTEDSLSRRVNDFLYDALTNVSQDERFHGKFINGIANTAMESGDSRVVSFMMSGIRKVLRTFVMPGNPGIPDFNDRAREAHNSGVFTAEDLAAIKYSQIHRIWKVGEQTVLTAQGEQDKSKILEYAKKLERVFPNVIQLANVA